ncbi:MAG: AzlC family ABC transporter permease [Clostridia bacterium]|nr:AzlC family ABC transporter permease [Clostridia bacterium]
MQENNNFRMGLRDGIPIALGYLSVSFAFGIFATGSGLSVLEAVLISALNVTSAGQLAAVPIIVSAGAFAELALSQLIINLRYALMSVSLSQRLGDSVRLRDRFLISFVNTDEVFAVAMSKECAVGRKYMLGLIITPFFAWTLGTFLGAVAGNILPAIVVSALGIAIYAMFIAIVIPEAKKNLMTALCALVSIALSCAFYFIPVLKSVPSGFVVIICAVAASLFFAHVAPIPDEALGADEEVRDA